MESFQQPAFSFIALTEDFDPDHVPVDGEEYLRWMFHERSKCPLIVVAHNRDNEKYIGHANELWEQRMSVNVVSHEPLYRVDIVQIFIDLSAFINKQQVDLSEGTPESLLPTSEWMHVQSNLFRKLRDEVTSIRNSNDYEYEACDLPISIDGTSWLEYCQHKQPSLRSMLHINQRDLESVVEIKSGWLTDDLEWYFSNSEWYPKWVYSSLACLRLPLEGRVVSSLREIAKSAIMLRKQLSPNEVNLATPLNVIISIVTRCFNQHDLHGANELNKIYD